MESTCSLTWLLGSSGAEVHLPDAALRSTMTSRPTGSVYTYTRG